jgi:hypothetical protein
LSRIKAGSALADGCGSLSRRSGKKASSQPGFGKTHAARGITASMGRKKHHFLSDKPEGVNGIGKEGDIGTHLDSLRVDAVAPFFRQAGSNPSESVNP